MARVAEVPVGVEEEAVEDDALVEADEAVVVAE